jgi:hypothetical protein
MMRVLLTVLLCCAAVFAQETKEEKKKAASERALRGTVTDAGDKFINGAVVYLKDTRTKQVRSFITQQNGAYVFFDLKNDNDYQVMAKYNDKVSGWKTLSIFDSRREPVINLKVDKAEQK